MDFKRKRLLGTNAEYLVPSAASPTATNVNTQVVTPVTRSEVSGSKSRSSSRSSTPVSAGKDMLRRVNKSGYVESHTCPVCGDSSHEVCICTVSK